MTTMFVNEDARMIYLAHGHTASTATALTLMRSCGFSEPDGGWHHRRLRDAKSPLRDRDLDGWIIFTGVRNPFDVALSWVFQASPQMKGRGGPSFDLAAFRWSLVPSYYVSSDRLMGLHLDDAHEVVRAESLSEDLSRVLKMRGLGPVAVPVMNAGKRRAGRHRSQFYTPETRSYVEDRFGGELEELGYEYEEAA